MVKYTSVAAVLILLVGLFGCGKKQRYEAQYLELFDTVTTIVGYYPQNTKDIFTSDVEDFHQRMEEYHKLYDIYNAYDNVVNLYIVNQQAGRAPVAVSEEIMELLVFGKEMYHKTQGRVNIAFGAVTALWHEARETALNDPSAAYVPDKDSLQAAAAHTDIEDLVLDVQAGTVYFADPMLRLDVGAIAKGYAAQRAVEESTAKGFGNILVSVGGNVCAVGTKGGTGEKWNVGVQNPDANAQNQNLHILLLEDRSFVSSGDYQRFFVVDGKAYHHIIHPETLYPEQNYRAVCVVTPDSGNADALSTALFNSTVEEGKALAAAFPNTEVLWLKPDGTETMTDGFGELLQK